MKEYEFKIHNVLVNRNEYLLLLKENGNKNRYVPMVIGAYEANGILITIEGVRTERPFAYDVCGAMLQELDAKIEKILIYDLIDGLFYAYVFLRLKNGDLRIYDIRPSDGIALSLRFKAPIYIVESVLEKIEEDRSMQEALGSFVQNEDESSQSSESNESGYFEDMDYLGGNYPDKEKKIENQVENLQKLDTQLTEAVNDERYEDAAKIRDQIMKLKK